MKYCLLLTRNPQQSLTIEPKLQLVCTIIHSWRSNECTHTSRSCFRFVMLIPFVLQTLLFLESCHQQSLLLCSKIGILFWIDRRNFYFVADIHLIGYLKMVKRSFSVQCLFCHLLQHSKGIFLFLDPIFQLDCRSNYSHCFPYRRNRLICRHLTKMVENFNFMGITYLQLHCY